MRPDPGAALADEAWLAGDDAALPPPRPRRRLTPLTGCLCAVLLVACGFIGGVLVQRHAGASSGGQGGAGFAALASALRGGGQGGGAAGAAGVRGGAAAGGGAASPFGNATIGQVTTVRGDTLYVTDAQGNTVKVKAAPGATVTRTVDAKPRQIHPGEQVVVRGVARNGTVTATSITAGAAGAGLGAVAAGGFGGSVATAGGAGRAAGATSARGQLDQLFGPSDGRTR